VCIWRTVQGGDTNPAGTHTVVNVNPHGGTHLASYLTERGAVFAYTRGEVLWALHENGYGDLQDFDGMDEQEIREVVAVVTPFLPAPGSLLRLRRAIGDRVQVKYTLLPFLPPCLPVR